MGDLTIYGDCDPRFERVRGAFVKNFQRRGEVGAAVSVMVDGHYAVDLWAGHADQAKTRAWERDTIVNVRSTTKGLCAMCAHRLADHGQLDFEAPVAKYWPEFAQAGKGMIPVSYLLNHKAGLAAIRALLRDEELFSWEKVTTELARQEPWWEPGTKHGYHAITFGWLVGEVVRRISGKSLGTYFRDEIAGPLEADAYIGFDASLDPRVADTIFRAASDARRTECFRRDAEGSRVGERQSHHQSAQPDAADDHQLARLAGRGDSSSKRPCDCTSARTHLWGARARRRNRRHPDSRLATDRALLCRAVEGDGRSLGFSYTFQPRVHAFATGSGAGPESPVIRAPRRGRLARVCRSRPENRLRLCDEPNGLKRNAARSANHRAD